MRALRAEIGLAGAVAASNFVRLRHPLKISVALTYRCNLRCRICNIWKRPAGPELTAGEIDAFFRGADGFRWVGITGGEPFLRPDLAEIVDRIAARSPRLGSIHFNTNGQLPDRVLGLLEGVRRRHPRLRAVLTVSLDGPPAVHDEIRGRARAWERAVETFVAVKGLAGVKAQVGYTVCAHNLGRFPEFLEALRGAWPALRFDDINVNVFQTSAHYYANREMAPPGREALEGEIDAILALDRDRPSVNNLLRRRYLRLYRRYLALGRCPLRCQALSATCFLDPGGDLYPCIVHRRVVANVRSGSASLREIWNAAPARALQRECSRHRCPGCWSPCDAFSTIAGSLLRSVLA